MAKFETIKIEKGMYANKGKSLTDILEELDPSENYKGTALEGLDAFQRQLKRFDIKVSGKSSDRVEKFLIILILRLYSLNMFQERLLSVWNALM